MVSVLKNTLPSRVTFPTRITLLKSLPHPGALEECQARYTSDLVGGVVSHAVEFFEFLSFPRSDNLEESDS
jgi:hypothetical protein